MIRLTIITCTYQAASVVERTLNSVLEQTFRHVEHLIIDGASKDATLQLAETYMEASNKAENGHSVVVVSEPDRGLYDAMNKGIALATGDYLVFLNAGDVFPHSGTLEQIAASAGDGDILPGVLYGHTDIVDENGRFLHHRRLQPPPRLTWRSFRQGMLVCHQAFYARTDLAKRTPYNLRYRYSADVDWCIRVMKEAEHEHLPLKEVNAVIVNYLDGGLTTAHHRASLKERFMVMREHYGFLPSVVMHLWFAVRAIL